MSDQSMDLWPIDRLLREANNGNTEAFGVFCGRSLPGLARYAEARCHDLNVPPDLGNDFVHDAFIKALRRLTKCGTDERGKTPVVSPAWLRTVIYNSILDWRKKNGRVRHGHDDVFFREPWCRMLRVN
jgi:DNA-directed RNA polymerase specialized sigma24 family protein